MYPRSTAITAFDLFEKGGQSRRRGDGHDIEHTIVSIARVEEILSEVAR